MTGADESDSARATESGLVFIDPASGFEIRAITLADHEDAAALLTELPDLDRVEEAMALIRSILETPRAAILVAFEHQELVAVYALRRDGLANDLALIVVRADKRRRGIGRLLLQDALRRSGKRPLAAQTPEETLGFFRTCGFKLVGRRVQPSGAVHFRVGWHAPGTRFKGGTSSVLTTGPVESRDRDAPS